MAEPTFFWHDYETFGVNPMLDRPAQFAGIRTNLDLEPIGEPLVLYCKPAKDRLPSPEACLITAITPQIAEQNGLIEADFIHQIQQKLATANTCGAGYNSIRFDDEVTRHTLYRNFRDPYSREWQNGCSRWDIIDLVRMTCALRPDGIEWPLNDQGKPSFRLEHLSAANGISHDSAHDALSDVYATIGLARLIRQHQPKLYHWLLDLRNKHRVLEQIDLQDARPFVHTTRMYPSELGCTSLVMPLVFEKKNKSSLLVYDLRFDPEEFFSLDPDQLSARLYTPREELADGCHRLPVKSLKINHCPAIAPLGTLNQSAAERIEIDLDQCARFRQKIQANPGFIDQVSKAFSLHSFAPSENVDGGLYDGFFNDDDRKLIQQVGQSTPSELADGYFPFHDKRLPELLWRYRARNWPESLSVEEKAQWQEYCLEIYQQPDTGMESLFSTINELKQTKADDPGAIQILQQLELWGDSLL